MQCKKRTAPRTEPCGTPLVTSMHLEYSSPTLTRSFSPHQHGFLPPRSCLYNLLVFEKAVTRLQDEGHTVEVTYLDFAKAFDSVNHRFLLGKMKSFGLGDAAWPNCCMGLVEEMGPTDQFCQMQLTHNRMRGSPEIVFFPRWVWHPYPCIQISQGSRGSDRQYVRSKRFSGLKATIRLDD